MRQLFILSLAFFIVFSSAAMAEGNKIIVIGEDGKVSELDVAPPSVLRKGGPIAPQRPVVVKPAPESEAKKPVAKPDALKQNAPKQAAPEKATPKAAPVKDKKPVKKPAVPKKKKTSTAKDKKARKQNAAPAATAPAQEYVSPRPQRLGPAMTPDDAIRIALDAAPPARSVNAYPVNFKGLHAYEVVFRDEGGDHSVFVDRESGKIVK